MARSTARAVARPDTRRAASAQHANTGSPWEWVTGAIGLCLIVATIGYLVYAALTTPDGPPQIQLATAALERTGVGYVVIVSATNDGPTTAAAVEIEGTLRRDDGSAVETSTAVIDYLPRLSKRTAGLFFSRPPAEYRMELRPLGYAAP